MKKGLFIFYLFSCLFAFGQTEPVSLPFSNSFESEADRDYWYSMSTGPGNPWIFSEDVSTIYGPSDGSFYARFQSTTQNPGTAWLISKGITMEAGENIALEFDYRSSLATNFPQKLQVLLKSIPSPGTENTTQIWDAALADLQRLGVVTEVTGRRRGRVFSYGRYLAILSEGTDPLPAAA